MINKIILDFDSTIVDSRKAYVDVYNEKFSSVRLYRKPDISKMKRWDMKDECPLQDNCLDIFGNLRFFDYLEFFPYAKQAIEMLNARIPVAICTLGTPKNLEYKIIWIERNLPTIKNLILLSNDGITPDKSIVNMQNSIFVDDVKSNLDSSNAPSKILFGERFPWNEEWDGVHHTDWISLYNYIILT